jgi:hypothetical protein
MWENPGLELKKKKEKQVPTYFLVIKSIYNHAAFGYPSGDLHESGVSGASPQVIRA